MRCQKSLAISRLRCSCPQTGRRWPLSRNVSNAAARQGEVKETGAEDKTKDEKDNAPTPGKEEEGAMSRRLAEMTEQYLLEGGKSARNNIQHTGFSEELKSKMEERVAAASFKSQHAGAFAVVDMPDSAGKHSRDIASTAPWSGTESIHDASLRMLNDAHKPMRVPFKAPVPGPVNLKPAAPKSSLTSGQRLASARDRTSNYTLSQDLGLSEKEREAYRTELRERFTPGFRPVPISVNGLTSLANERIEDAIAQGQFRNIPRGKGKCVERDPNAGNPHLDTTEYLMNRMLQRQNIAPEWVQKQQGLKTEVDRFREHLRVAWRRRAAMLIASEGGSMKTQMRRAQAYAAAEARRANRDSNQPFTETNDNAENKRLNDNEHGTKIDHEGRITRLSEDEDPSSQAPPEAPPERLPVVSPLRDPQYLSTEREYHELTIKKLNAQIRSYNIQAPQVSQKPYLSLERELNKCYADVAPSLAEEIGRRATERAHDSTITRPERDNVGLQQTLGLGHQVPVYDEDTSKGYGFKQFWKNLWGKKGDSSF